MKTIDRYLAKHFVIPFVLCAIVFVGLVFFIDSAEKFRPIVYFTDKNTVNSSAVIWSYFINSMIVYFFSFLPYLLVLAATIMFVNLNKTGQIKALYSFGFKFDRVFLYARIVVLLLGFILLVMNLSALPHAKRQAEESSRTIKGLPMKTKAFIDEEPISFQQQKAELMANKSISDYFPQVLNPPVSQVIYYSEMLSTSQFKKVVITRLDIAKKLRQRIVLQNAQIKNGYMIGESGLLQDYYSNGDLYREIILANKNSYRFVTTKEGDVLHDHIAFYYAPDKTSIYNLFSHYTIKEAREEIFKRLMIPLKCFLLFTLSLALSSLLDLKKIYMSFAVLMLVVVSDFVADNLATLFSSNNTSILPILLSPVFLWVATCITKYKARV